MHRHECEQLDTERPERSTRADPPNPLLMRAAAEGRTDVLGPAGMVGLQRAVGNGATARMVGEERSPVLDVLTSGGEALDATVREDMESRMGHDFGDVRVHTGAAADDSARSVRAHAYTAGSNIVFQRGAYDPGSVAGRTLLAHELTHVVQQRSGPVDGTATGDGIQVSHPSDRFEQAAAANAEHVMSLPAPAPIALAAATTPSPSVVQRAAEDEEEVQAAHDPSLPSTVQRDESEEEPAE